MSESYIARINFHGSIATLLHYIADEYALGQVKSYEAIDIGYEDYNLKLVTNRGSFLVKLFASERTDDECKRYVSVIESVLSRGVAHPQLIPSASSAYFHKRESDQARMIVMDWVEGETYYSLNRTPSEDEIEPIIKAVVAINSLQVEVPFQYDEWAIDNIVPEFKLVESHLTTKDRRSIAALIDTIDHIQKDTLPRGLVHGDLIKTNVIKAEDDTIWLLDFSVANETYRINELAVLCCNLFFDETSVDKTRDLYDRAVELYTKYLQLTPYELKSLPYFIKAAHAMHVIGATKYEVAHGASPENDYWKRIGQIGLHMDIA